MADLESDIMGQVARLPLKPSEANALLPLHEAISNALHAITDRFGDQALADKGRIDIEILHGDGGDDDQPPVIGFVVSDNGIGLNAYKFKSFSTPFSQHKMTRGGKSVGRRGWLKVFEKIEVPFHGFRKEAQMNRDQFRRTDDRFSRIAPHLPSDMRGTRMPSVIRSQSAARCRTFRPKPIANGKTASRRSSTATEMPSGACSAA